MLLANLFLKNNTPLWILLTLELIFFQWIILFTFESITLNEFSGYIFSYILVILTAVESGFLLAVILILNKILKSKI